MELKRHQVHSLPTENGVIFKNRTTGTLVMKISNVAKKLYPAQHLYFTTDEEIKEGDWYLATIFGHGTEETKPLQWSVGTKPCGEQPMGRKIIATTDPKLITYNKRYFDKNKERRSAFVDKVNVPQPSQALIKAYCEQGGFDEVDVEYEINPILDLEILDGKTRVKETIFIPKVDPIHNTITTHRIVEKMYSLDEMKKMWIHLGEQGWGDSSGEGFDKWIKENLKQ